MAIVTIPTTFIDGDRLPVNDLNEALYSTTSGLGVYSELNGGVELQSTRNGSSDFSLRQEHLQPEQVVMTRYDGDWSTLDNMSDVSGRTSRDENNELVAKQQSLAGCGLRVYVPFDAAIVRWNISFFFYVAKWFGLSLDDQNSLYCEGGNIQTFVFVGNSSGFDELPELRRQYPMTWFKRAASQDYTTSSGGSTNHNKAPYSTEAEQASFMNLSFAQTDLKRGFYEAYLGFYVKPTKAKTGGIAKFFRETILAADKNDFDVKRNLELYQRLGIGCRNARVVAFR